MKRLIGYTLFWVAVGMALMLFITNGIFALCLILLFLICAYNFFCK